MHIPRQAGQSFLFLRYLGTFLKSVLIYVSMWSKYALYPVWQVTLNAVLKIKTGRDIKLSVILIFL